MDMNNANAAALDSLRTIYRSAKSGADIDPRALIAAVGEAVSAGHDVRPCLRHFEPFAFVRVDCVRGVDAATLCRSARERGGWKAAIVMASMLGLSEAWAAAMTAHYGPTGIHPSRCDADGIPTAETLAECPRVAESMALAIERWENLLGWEERHGGTTRWEYVAPMRTRAA